MKREDTTNRDDDDRRDRDDDVVDAASVDPVAERIVAFVDGAMSPPEAREFEASLAGAPELARRVDRARHLRRLVAALPRVAAPRELERYTSRIASAHSWRVARGIADVALADRLAALRRVSPPGDLTGVVMAAVREERAIQSLAVARRSYRPARAQWLPMLVAAALLLSVTTWLFDSRSTRGERPKGQRAFVFDVATLRPGQTSPGVAIDSTLIPPSFSARSSGGR